LPQSLQGRPLEHLVLRETVEHIAKAESGDIERIELLLADKE